MTTPAMAASVQYVVTAACTSEEVREMYTRWLIDRHVAMVLATGLPRVARVVRVDDPERQTWGVQTQYEFSSRETLETYLQHHAPELRKEGAEKFAGVVTFARTIGTIQAIWTAR